MQRFDFTPEESTKVNSKIQEDPKKVEDARRVL